MDVKWDLITILSSPNTNSTECFLNVYELFEFCLFVKGLFISLAHFSDGFLTAFEFFICSEYSFFVVFMCCKHLPVFGLSFHLFYDAFWCTEIPILFSETDQTFKKWLQYLCLILENIPFCKVINPSSNFYQSLKFWSYLFKLWVHPEFIVFVE